MVNFSEIQRKLKATDLKSSFFKSYNENKNFYIPKQARFTARFFQAATNFGAMFFLAKLFNEEAFLSEHGVTSTVNSMLIMSVLTPLCVGFCVAIYIWSVFTKAWSSRRILTAETILDFLQLLVWGFGFLAGIIQMGKGCPASFSTTTPCPLYNWFLAWAGFTTAGFLVGFVLDCKTWHTVLFAERELDSELLLDINRTTRMNR
ncbi:hypothetical protein CXG81DRAFT_13471 [Caulochytrium protostelioides]|uniref:MARVEL domain-containing protein n=1 Tax=Caulochytrium protostelioides TaxID=1555241 RepID=A0A4P9X5E1_9FUNG|nr:hypothetical protein CXG81DRAFT_13471 [Caulochytrium protostelioides]|eukprot:RKP00230.1 hypothetical protein CXG81DRAFT_13471 [Caulochytrium protostelioides]